MVVANADLDDARGINATLRPGFTWQHRLITREGSTRRRTGSSSASPW
jgi:hypothetical protein